MGVSSRSRRPGTGPARHLHLVQEELPFGDETGRQGPAGVRSSKGGPEARSSGWSAAELADAVGLHRPTPEQRRIIEAEPRPLLVVAGAGSGKTETMASRVVWLVANGYVDPDQVLGLTFTRKAATELGERIAGRLRQLRQRGIWTPAPEEDGVEVLGGTPTVSTYHAYAGRLVGEHALRIGVEPEFRLLTEAAAWQVAAEAVERFDGPLEDLSTPGSPDGPALSTMVGAVVDLAGEMAEHLLTADRVAGFFDDFDRVLAGLPLGSRVRVEPKEVRCVRQLLQARRQMLPLVAAYTGLKRDRDSLDFADQMALAAELVRRFPDIAGKEQQRFRAVLLDEFQDTSEAQLELLSRVFGTDDACVTAVGDPHQSIYGWRGASATTLARFPGRFGDAAVLPLSTSWRNDDAVLDAANATSGPLRGRAGMPVERLRARPGAGEGRVEAARLLTVEDEARQVAAWVARHWRRDAVAREHQPGRRPLTAAVLCRKRAQFAMVVDALKAQGLPVEVLGLGGLLSTPEVLDIVALLHVVQDPARGDQLMRLLTGPLVRLGPADLDGLAAWSRVLTSRAIAAAAAAATATAVPAATAVRAATVPAGAEDQAPESADRASIVEALDDLPGEGWRGKDGQRLSAAALERLAGLRGVIGRLRALTGLPLADLVGEAERALGLDIEVLARPEYVPSTARAHLDAFADVAGTFSSSAERPTLGGFLAWLEAAREQERGLDKGYIEVSDQAVQVLTVHAAKGLEWDVVAVPGLVDGTFPARVGYSVSKWGDGEWTMTAPTDKGWCGGGLSGVPYDMRGDRDGLPRLSWRDAPDLKTLEGRLLQFYAEGGQHELAEERRLAYVAFTRARHGLLLTAPVWTDAATPRVTSPFLLELLDAAGSAAGNAGGVAAGDGVPLAIRGPWEPMPVPELDASGKAVAVNPRSAQPRTAQWPGDPMARRREQLADAAAVVEQAREAVRRGEPVSRAAAGPPGSPGWPGERGAPDTELDLLLAERAAAAERERTGVTEVVVPRHLSASDVVRLAGDPAAFALDLRRPLPSAPVLAARRGTAFHAWVEQHYARAAIVDVVDLPGSADQAPGDDADLPAMKAHFLASEWAERTPEAIEVAVETVIDGIAVRGRIDAVFRRDDGGCTVVDWKTGAVPSGREAPTRAVQLAAYRVAYARLRGIPLQDVDGAFYYAATGQTVWPDLPDEAGLRRVLRQLQA